jgi:hypothetical protein
VKTNLKSAALSKEEKTSDGYELTFMGLRKGPMSVDDVFKENQGVLTNSDALLPTPPPLFCVSDTAGDSPPRS